jgi:hypothetical protein
MIKVSKWQSGFALLVGLGIMISAVTHLVIAAPKLAQSEFTDIQGNWSQSCITQLASQGVISGYPSRTFRPNSPVTRAEFAAMIGKAFPNAPKTRNSVDFVDVSSNYWADSAIKKASETAFLSGYPGKVFKPSQNIPRAQVLVALASGLNYSPSQSAATTLKANFADASKVPAYAQNGIAAATEKRLVVDYPDVKYLNPNKLATRAEVSAFLCQALAGSGKIANAIPEQYIAGSGSSTPTSSNSTSSNSTSTYYVSSQGSDKGKGTQSSPWRTLNKALASVPADKGYTIRVGAGTFDLGEKAVSVPSGVKLVGSGVNSTTIMGQVQLAKVKNLTVSGIKFDGKNRAYELGMHIRDANKLEIHDLAFNSYANSALNMERVSNAKFYNINVTDSTYNNRVPRKNNKQSSAFDFGNLTNVDFHDINIDTTARGGRAMGTSSDAWAKGPGSNRPAGELRNVKFYNLDIKVDKWNAWGSGYTPQMAIELWNHNCYNCEVYNSTFNSTVSLASPENKLPTNIRVHHNLWYAPKKPFYACEVSSNNIEFDHNYVRGGSYPISSFGYKYPNLNVHHNVFEKTGGPFLIGNFHNPKDNFKFINNTVYINNSKDPIFRFHKGESKNQKISNNIFYNLAKTPNNSLGLSVGVENNLFFNVKPVGSGAKQFDPKFKLSGTLPSPYYVPTNGSTAKLGAIQTSDSAWIVGNKGS